MKALETIVDFDQALITNVIVHIYTIPTSAPESDGTAAWDATTMIVIEIDAASKTGIGYTYADPATGYFIERSLKPLLDGRNAFDIPSIACSLISSIRNQGICGIAMMGVSAIDNALWDLKAKLLNIPLHQLLGKATDHMLLYGSGGFTSYTEKQLKDQFERWAMLGIKHFKMKVGREPGKDVQRVKAARKIIGDDAHLFVDANGAYTIKQALYMANQFAEYDVTWFEEPVSSDNVDGLHFIRLNAPAGMNIAAGEYGYNLPYFTNLLKSNAVDVLQADATRCSGISAFLKAGSVSEAVDIPFSSHCAPMQHLHAALSLPKFYIAEYFFDHERIESMLFDDVPKVVDGFIQPDEQKPGSGIELKVKDAEPYRV